MTCSLSCRTLKKSFPSFAFVSGHLSFLVTLETFNLFDIYCLCQTRYFGVFRKRHPSRSLGAAPLLSRYMSFQSPILIHVLFQPSHPPISQTISNKSPHKNIRFEPVYLYLHNLFLRQTILIPSSQHPELKILHILYISIKGQIK